MACITVDRPTAALHTADALGDVDVLPIGMRMPRRPRARREVNTARRQARAL